MRVAGKDGVSRPPFGIRDVDRVNEELGRYALPHGFNAVPIVVYNNDDIHDDVSYDGCPYISNVEETRVDNSTLFMPY